MTQARRAALFGAAGIVIGGGRILARRATSGSSDLHLPRKLVMNLMTGLKLQEAMPVAAMTGAGRFVLLCWNPDRRKLTFEAYMNRKLPEVRPGTHPKTGSGDLPDRFDPVSRVPR